MPTKPVISAEDKARRQQVVDSALGSLRLEGLEPSADALQILEQFKQGQISLDEMSQAIDGLYSRRPVHVSE
ncbi:MAG: antitoxin VbhA family protein [Acidobacteriaceae bacterium]|nr:antitoxin VbhA family protein [Acidobacteriaceae bacterium]MBV9678352.1 antitoxin VbhA family protein [Acidobacteriaceae bacterium]